MGRLEFPEYGGKKELIWLQCLTHLQDSDFLFCKHKGFAKSVWELSRCIAMWVLKIGSPILLPSLDCQSDVDFSCIITNSNVFQAREKSRTMCIYEKRPTLVWLKLITRKEPNNSTILQPKSWLHFSLSASVLWCKALIAQRWIYLLIVCILIFKGSGMF